MKRGKRRRRGKVVALWSLLAGLSVLLVSIVGFKDILLERWHLYKLGAEEPSTRIAAARALGEMRSDAAIPRLVEIVGAPGEEAFVAVEALLTIGPDAVPALAEAVEKQSVEFRRRVAKVEAKAGSSPAAAVSLLAGMLDDADSLVRARAAGTLESFAPAILPAVPGLVAALEDTARAVSVAAGMSLTKLGPDAVPLLVASLRGRERATVLKVSGVLRQHGDLAAEELCKQLREPEDSFPEAAALALASLGSRAVPALTRALGDPDRRLRMRAARTLGDIGSEAAVPALRETARGEDKEVRRQALRALGFIGLDVRTAVAVYMEALKDPDPSIRSEAATILPLVASRRRQVTTDLLRGMLEDDDLEPDSRRLLLDVLAEID